MNPKQLDIQITDGVTVRFKEIKVGGFLADGTPADRKFTIVPALFDKKKGEIVFKLVEKF